MIVWSTFSLTRSVANFRFARLSNFVFTFLLVNFDNDFWFSFVLFWDNHAVLLISVCIWRVETNMAIILVAETFALRTLFWTSVSWHTVMVFSVVDMKFVNRDFTFRFLSYWDNLLVCEFSKLVFPYFFLNYEGLFANTFLSALYLAFVFCWALVLKQVNTFTIIFMNHFIFIIFIDCFIVQVILRRTVIITHNTFMHTFFWSTVMLYMSIHNIMLASSFT